MTTGVVVIGRNEGGTTDKARMTKLKSNISARAIG